MHEKTYACSVWPFEDVQKAVALLDSVLVELNKAAVTDLKTLWAIMSMLKTFSYLGFFYKNTGLGGFKWIKAPIISPVPSGIKMNILLTIGFIIFGTISFCMICQFP